VLSLLHNTLRCLSVQMIGNRNHWQAYRETGNNSFLLNLPAASFHILQAERHDQELHGHNLLFRYSCWFTTLSCAGRNYFSFFHVSSERIRLNQIKLCTITFFCKLICFHQYDMYFSKRLRTIPKLELLCLLENYRCNCCNFLSMCIDIYLLQWCHTVGSVSNGD